MIGPLISTSTPFSRQVGSHPLEPSQTLRSGRYPPEVQTEIEARKNGIFTNDGAWEHHTLFICNAGSGARNHPLGRVPGHEEYRYMVAVQPFYEEYSSPTWIQKPHRIQMLTVPRWHRSIAIHTRMRRIIPYAPSIAPCRERAITLV